MPSTVWPMRATKSPGAMPTSADSSCSFGSTANAVIRPTITTLVMFLAPSKRRLGPNRFLAPVSGLSFFGSGLTPAAFSRGRTWMTFASTPAPMHAAATGPTVMAIVSRPSTASWPSIEAVTARGLAISAIVARIESPSFSNMCGPHTATAISPPIRTSAPFRSWERATCPFLRASSLRLGVAFSVFSPAPPAIVHPLCSVQGLERLADALGELVADPAGRERQRGRDQQEADEDLGRKADREDVELRHDARHDAEAGVGDDHGEQDRSGDLDSRDEDLREGVLGAAGEGADVRELGEPDQVVGAGQAADHPCVAADHDEHHHADQRVELGEDAALLVVDRVYERAEREADLGVEEGAGRRHRREQRGDSEREPHPHEDLLQHQAADRQRVGRDLLVGRRERREPDRERDRHDHARPGGDHLRREQRRDDEQRADPPEREHEAHAVLLAQLPDGAVHWPTSPGIDSYRFVV